MIPYQKEKLENAICFFAKEHTAKAKKPLYQTYLYKYLALFDFQHLKAQGIPALGLKYIAMARGPVPEEIYSQRDNIKSDCFEFCNDQNGNKMVVPKKKRPDMDYFSPAEVKLMKTLIEIYAQNWIKASDMSDASHETILAWKRTWKEHPNTLIEYANEFDGEIMKKNDNDLTYPEEVYLIHRAINNCA